MPSIPEITTSIENHQTMVLDTHARKSQFQRNARGQLIRYAGGFSVVYPYITSSGEKWAFRCWHAKLGDTKKRSEAISATIQRARLPFLCGFTYTEKGIIVEGTTYPTTRMQWIDGVTIKKYLCSTSASTQKILDIASQFLQLIKKMHERKFAHGDLQHGNILVGNDGKLYLVDYDSFFCPELEGEKDIITGLKDYQHPQREKNRYASEKIDYFSELIIYTSILGIAYRPELINKYKVEDSEHLLFEAKDFEDITHSTIYQDLKGLGAIFPVLLNILEIYLSKRRIEDLEPFDIIMERMTKAPEISEFCYSPSKELYVGDEIKLSWAVNGEAKSYIDGVYEAKNYCERRLAEEGNNTFTLKVSNGFKDTQRTLEIKAYPLPNIDLSASNVALHKNTSEEATITWKVENASKVLLCHDGSTEEIEHSGNKRTSPQKTTKYTIEAIGLDGKRRVEKTITIGVYSPAEVSFTADKNTVLSKRAVELSWSVSNAKKIELIGWGKVPNKDHKTIEPEKDTTYTLKVTDAFGTKEHRLRIKTLPLPKIKFSTNKKKLNKDKGEAATLSWDIQNGTSMTLEYAQLKESIEGTGKKEIRLNETTKILIRCLALDQETTFEEEVTIYVFSEAKILFTTNRQYTIPEVPIEVSWNVLNSKKVELKDYGVVQASGKKEIKIKEETTITLIVTDEFSTQEKSITIKMLPLPTVKSLSIPVPELNKPLNISINIPEPETRICFPQITLPNVDFKVPSPPDMDGVYDTISSETRPSLFSEIKSLFFHYFNR